MKVVSEIAVMLFPNFISYFVNVVGVHVIESGK